MEQTKQKSENDTAHLLSVLADYERGGRQREAIVKENYEETRAQHRHGKSERPRAEINRERSRSFSVRDWLGFPVLFFVVFLEHFVCFVYVANICHRSSLRLIYCKPLGFFGDDVSGIVDSLPAYGRRSFNWLIVD